MQGTMRRKKITSHALQLALSVGSATMTLSLRSNAQISIMSPKKMTSSSAVSIVPDDLVDHALNTRHAKLQRGFLLSRLAALDVLEPSTAATVASKEHNEVSIYQRASPCITKTLAGIIDRNVPLHDDEVGTRISYSHEDNHSPGASTSQPQCSSDSVCLAAALVSRGHRHWGVASAPARIAVDVIDVDRIQSLCAVKPRWAARWLGDSAMSSSEKSSSPLACHWTDLLDSGVGAARPWNNESDVAAAAAHCNKTSVDLAVGWGVRECAVKLLGEPSRAFRMGNVTAVTNSAPQRRPRPLAPDINSSSTGNHDDSLMLSHSVKFQGIDAAAWHSQDLPPTFSFGVTTLILREEGNEKHNGELPRSRRFVVVVAVADKKGGDSV